MRSTTPKHAKLRPHQENMAHVASTEGRSRKERQENRRLEVDFRAGAYAILTLDDRLKLIDSRPGKSLREKMRISKLIDIDMTT